MLKTSTLTDSLLLTNTAASVCIIDDKLYIFLFTPLTIPLVTLLNNESVIGEPITITVSPTFISLVHPNCNIGKFI